MGSGEYSAPRRSAVAAPAAGTLLATPTGTRARAAATLALVALAATACDAEGPTAPAADGGADGELLVVPPFLASSRAVDTALLSVTLTVGEDEVPVSLSNGVGTASFVLPAGSEQTFPIEILWSYAVTGRADPIPIARASRSVSRADPRALRVTSYRTDEFDDDRDGRSNFAEIDEGSDPLSGGGGVPVEPNANQDDCADTVLPGERPEDVAAQRDLFRFGNTAFDETVSIDFDIEQLVYHATLFLETSGTVTIEHRSGLPTNTNALVYDRRRDAVGFEGSANVRVAANNSTLQDGVPALVSARLVDAGLYCYALFGEEGANFGEGAVLTDIVLRVQFTPDPS